MLELPVQIHGQGDLRKVSTMKDLHEEPKSGPYVVRIRRRNSTWKIVGCFMANTPMLAAKSYLSTLFGCSPAIISCDQGDAIIGTDKATNVLDPDPQYCYCAKGSDS